jgi:sugar (pentulose or hexulose) kinase
MHLPPEEQGPRGVVVLDIGATNTKIVLFAADLTMLAEDSVPAQRHADLPYLAIDPQPVMVLVARSLPEFDAQLPVDAIVPCAHGSAAALVDGNGQLVLPIMSYEADPPPEIVDGYAAIEPAFGEVFAPTNPLGLTLARQLHWQETRFPAAFARACSIMPLAQYFGFRLCGVRASEVSALGAQTHLWAPLARDYSMLARERSWASGFAPLRWAWEPLGRATQELLRGRATVLTGVHDSNANLLRYLGGPEFTLLSTGTWIIGFVQGIDINQLDPACDQVSNTTVFGDPIASCRFMGGREFELVADGAPANMASREVLRDLLARGVTAWPSFTSSGGPVPGTASLGRIDGPVGDARERATLASLYCAQMSALALRKIGSANRVIVDGPFSTNDVYLEVLAACLPGQAVLAADEKSGTAVGAASLALMSNGTRISPQSTQLRRIDVPPDLLHHAGLLRWFEQLRDNNP